MSTRNNLREAEPAFVLHSYPYRETSLIVEVFSLNHGRVALLAKGAKRPHSAVRGLLMPFFPLELSWSGKNELKTLHKAEWQGAMTGLKGEAMMCGFYLNELLLRLLPREDAHPELYTHYLQALAELAQGKPVAPVLRRFEKRLLQQLGYALLLQHEAGSQHPIRSEQVYQYDVEQGALPPGTVASSGQKRVELHGKTLLDLGQEDFSDSRTLQQCKTLMRAVLAFHLGEQPLHTRQLLVDLQQL